MSAIDPALMALLICPITRGPLLHDALTDELVSEQARLAFPIRDGVPVMVVEAARTF
ncbi:hypothetical protein SAMN05444678_105173 [Sphingomonas sp. YR710]|uniref:Trm112 family protein n=1 Tax=Sphingomonas sp. YR710 TaxID=1882773 RepID=UPI000880D385|nr:Trm112 family protein [Sphingomonas sp. YR710]SDC76560.1 hypothetical protein SAMN05444678_105173 [Sphingomonas sp. YR710]